MRDQISAEPALHSPGRTQKQYFCPYSTNTKQQRQCNLKPVSVQTISNLTVTENMRRVIKRLLVFSAVCPDSVVSREMSHISGQLTMLSFI